MHDQNAKIGANAAMKDAGRTKEPSSARALELCRRIWRPAGTLVAFALALVLLDQENDRLRERIDHLKSDPDTIMIEARQKLHYAKADEVIVALPADKSEKSQPAAP